MIWQMADDARRWLVTDRRVSDVNDKGQQKKNR